MNALAIAASLICAYSPGIDCQIANSGNTQFGGMPANLPAANAYFAWDGKNQIRLRSGDINPITLASEWIHEIQHQKDSKWMVYSQENCMKTELHAYTVQIAFFDWASDTFGSPPRIDSPTDEMLQDLHHDDDFIQEGLRRSLPNCSTW